MVGPILSILLGMGACSNQDQPTFERAYRAGKALQVYVNSTGGGPLADGLLREFQTEVSVLEGRARDDRAAETLKSTPDYLGRESGLGREPNCTQDDTGSC